MEIFLGFFKEDESGDKLILPTGKVALAFYVDVFGLVESCIIAIKQIRKNKESHDLSLYTVQALFVLFNHEEEFERDLKALTGKNEAITLKNAANVISTGQVYRMKRPELFLTAMNQFCQYIQCETVTVQKWKCPLSFSETASPLLRLMLYINYNDKLQLPQKLINAAAKEAAETALFQRPTAISILTYRLCDFYSFDQIQYLIRPAASQKGAKEAYKKLMNAARIILDKYVHSLKKK